MIVLTSVLQENSLGLYSLSGKTSYRQISWSLEAARLGVIIIAPLWSLTGTSAALLPRGLSNFRAIGKVLTRISRPRDFTRSCSKTSYRLVNRGPGDVAVTYVMTNYLTFLFNRLDFSICNFIFSIWNLLCLFVACHESILPIYRRVTWLALGQP